MTTLHPPLDLDDPVVAATVAKVKARGGAVISSTTVSFLPVATAKSKVSPAVSSGPAKYGCGLSVILSKKNGVIYSDNLTSCKLPYTRASMDSDIEYGILGDAFFPSARHAEKSSTATTSFTMNYTFKCVNKNNTDFKTETNGTLVLGGQDYYAYAYDDLPGQACGTS